MKKYYVSLLLAVFAAVSFAQSMVPQAEALGDKKVVAILVTNDSSVPELKDRAKFMESTLSSMISNSGYAVINQDLVVRKLNDYLGDPNAKYRSQVETFLRSLKESSTDTKLFEDASGLRMTEMLGADYILSVSLASLTKEKINYKGQGIVTQNHNFKLRCNYNLYEGGMGMSTAGANVTSEKTIRISEGLQTETNDVVDSLLEDAAQKLAADLKAKKQENKVMAKQNTEAGIEISFVLDNVKFPRVVELGDGAFQIEDSELPIGISNINLEIDGVSQSSGKKLTLSRGLHSLKVNQPGIMPFEKMINVTGKSDQKITFQLNITEKARARLKADMDYMQAMVDKVKDSRNKDEMSQALTKRVILLSKAEAEKLKGIAEFYKNSRWNILYENKSDVKVDAKEFPEIHQNSQSIFGPMN